MEVKIISEGKIVKLVRHRGFGFIASDDTDDDIFFHHSELEDIYFEDLSVGDTLEFTIEETDKGPEAKSISKVGGSSERKSEVSEDVPLAEQEFADEDLGW